MMMMMKSIYIFGDKEAATYTESNWDLLIWLSTHMLFPIEHFNFIINILFLFLLNESFATC